ncbi:MAG: HEAT repeat domain-containing protein [Burkholderiales bacterium]|nr:HEAT repeat domain-containing protein [Burkholderiales bacterium]
MSRTSGPRMRRWSTPRLIRRALAHAAARRAWNALSLLQRRGSAGTLGQLRVLARSANAHRRALAMDIAGQLHVPGPPGRDAAQVFAAAETEALLLAGLSDPNPRVLQAAIFGLAHRPAAAALPLLVHMTDHPDSRIRFALARALGSYAEPDATAALMRLARDRDDDVRDWATFGIGALRDTDDESIRSLLWANAHDPDRDVRGEAVVGLARRGDPRVVELLRQRLADGDCRGYELEAVQEMPRPELLAPLQTLLAMAERSREHSRVWLGELLDAIEACELVADAAA